MREILESVRHRPWPLPRRPWVATQRWEDLLFAHWPLRPEVVRPLLPAGLALDTFEGEAWIGVVPFDLSRHRLRGIVPFPFMSAFAELNVRTYVVHDGKPGVLFFSLDAASRVAVRGARRFFLLPYFDADMAIERSSGKILYRSRRTHHGAPPAEFDATYAPTCGGSPTPAIAGTLEHFLVERYALYTSDKKGRIYRGDIHHLPWPLERADAEIKTNTMLPAGVPASDTAPLLHFARRLDVLIWPIVRA